MAVYIATSVVVSLALNLAVLYITLKRIDKGFKDHLQRIEGVTVSIIKKFIQDKYQQTDDQDL